MRFISNHSCAPQEHEDIIISTYKRKPKQPVFENWGKVEMDKSSHRICKIMKSFGQHMFFFINQTFFYKSNYREGMVVELVGAPVGESGGIVWVTQHVLLYNS